MNGEEFIQREWDRHGSQVCDICGRRIIYDVDSGYWIHAEFGKVDGVNGLFCFPGMWDGSMPKRYAKPAQRWAAWGTGV
jgi:hypothetical protein